jgi:hypothetical protein
MIILYGGSMWNDIAKLKPVVKGTYLVTLSNGDIGVADCSIMRDGKGTPIWEVNTDIVEYHMLDDSGFYAELQGDVKYWMEIPPMEKGGDLNKG